MHQGINHNPEPGRSWLDRCRMLFAACIPHAMSLAARQPLRFAESIAMSPCHLGHAYLHALADHAMEDQEACS